jgi:hypothetical protein
LSLLVSTPQSFTLIKTLAPLGATHDIVLILAYGELPAGLPESPNLGGESTREVTVTAHLKPRSGAKGESRHLQFKGPAIDVESELAEKLPQAVARIVAHTASLDELDQQLEAEKKKAQEETQKKIATAKKEAEAKAAAKKPVAKPAAKAPKPAAKAPAKKSAPAKKPAPAKPSAGAAEAALAALHAAGTPPVEPTAAPAEDPLAELAKLTASADASAEEAVEL